MRQPGTRAGASRTGKCPLGGKIAPLKINRELKGRSHELELGFCLVRETFGERGNQVLGQVSRGQENVRQVEKSRLKKLAGN
jgi:hypothetical protein